MHAIDFCNGPGQRAASRWYGKFEKILIERTGNYCAVPHMGRDRIFAEHPDIAPGMDGFPFNVE